MFQRIKVFLSIPWSYCRNAKQSKNKTKSSQNEQQEIKHALINSSRKKWLKQPTRTKYANSVRRSLDVKQLQTWSKHLWTKQTNIATSRDSIRYKVLTLGWNVRKVNQKYKIAPETQSYKHVNEFSAKENRSDVDVRLCLRAIEEGRFILYTITFESPW